MPGEDQNTPVNSAYKGKTKFTGRKNKSTVENDEKRDLISLCYVVITQSSKEVAYEKKTMVAGDAHSAVCICPLSNNAQLLGE